MSTDNKKLVWIVVAVSVFVLVIYTTAMFIFTPDPRKGGELAPASPNNSADSKALDPSEYMSSAPNTKSSDKDKTAQTQNQNLQNSNLPLNNDLLAQNYNADNSGQDMSSYQTPYAAGNSYQNKAPQTQYSTQQNQYANPQAQYTTPQNQYPTNQNQYGTQTPQYQQNNSPYQVQNPQYSNNGNNYQNTQAQTPYNNNQNQYGNNGYNANNGAAPLPLNDGTDTTGKGKSDSNIIVIYGDRPNGANPPQPSTNTNTLTLNNSMVLSPQQDPRSPVINNSNTSDTNSASTSQARNAYPRYNANTGNGTYANSNSNAGMQTQVPGVTNSDTGYVAPNANYRDPLAEGGDSNYGSEGNSEPSIQKESTNDNGYANPPAVSGPSNKASQTSPARKSATRETPSSSTAKKPNFRSSRTVAKTQTTAKTPAKTAVAKRPAASASVPKVTEQYWVQAASFNNRERAESVRSELATQGFDAIITQKKIDDSSWYRVRIGPYSNQADAQKWLDKLDNARYRAAEIIKGSSF